MDNRVQQHVRPSCAWCFFGVRRILREYTALYRILSRLGVDMKVEGDVTKSADTFMFMRSTCILYFWQL